ncbi:vascular cell adhesion protein 1-like [Scomber scombrus]|uniref:vascular cell adhesion protein 1-like n=1 Tax=Scomber scombrus TaxID=13677 RepID=UPI002DDAA5E2|nr:vascular cell adhesion protein 1-like [Scomber scombrus]
MPSVSVSPSGEIIEGSSVTLTCSSDANPAAKYTWYKKNVNPDLQPLSKEPQLVFSSIQSSDSGEYYCTAESRMGKRTSENIFLDVKYAPKLPSVSVSPSGEIVEGSSVNLTCSSDANPAANYTWYKENEDSPKASGQIFTITDVRPEHSGNYYCEAQNRRGRHNSTLHVIVLKVVQGQNGWGVTYTSTHICAVKGSTVDINCTYRYPSMINNVDTVVDKTFWFTNLSNTEPVDLKNAGRVQYHCDKNDCTLRITDLKERDSAEYKFMFITNQPGGKYMGSAGVTLTVTDLQVQVIGAAACKDGTCELKYAYKMPFVSLSPSGEIIEGSSVTLTCSSDANPAAKYTWYKKNVNPDLQPLSKEPQLVFSSIQSSDSGEYYCTAESRMGKRTPANISIDVKYAPKLPSVSVSPSAEIVEGSSVTLTCSSDANPAANYTWYKENEDSPKASGQTFIITDVRPEHSGNYSCEAQNRRGRNNSTLHLNVMTGTGITIIAAGGTAAVLLLITILSVFLWMRKKRASHQSSEAEERPDDRERVRRESYTILPWFHTSTLTILK